MHYALEVMGLPVWLYATVPTDELSNEVPSAVKILQKVPL